MGFCAVATNSEERRSKLLAYLELFRIPNVFTAIADVAMGFLVATSMPGAQGQGLEHWTVLALLVIASSLMYTGGMVLNDVFDLEIDAKERPERPLPSGRISLRFARLLGFGMLLFGMALGWSVYFLTGQLITGILATLLAMAVLVYDWVLKRTPLGPLAMGTCRFLNVLLGMSVLKEWWSDPVYWLVAGGIGTYIVGVTWFARTEARASKVWHLMLAVAIMLVGIAMLAFLIHWPDRLIPRFRGDPRNWNWYFFWAVIGMLTLWRCVQAIVEPVPEKVQMAVKHCLLSLIVMDAAVCFAYRGNPMAVMILLLLLPSMVLGRWIYST